MRNHSVKWKKKIAADLATLTEQLNQFNPASEAVVGSAQKQVSEVVEARLNLQSQRIDSVNESVQKAQKTAADNAEMLHNLIVGIENMGENIK